jgi:hypothetical protein
LLQSLSGPSLSGPSVWAPSTNDDDDNDDNDDTHNDDDEGGDVVEEVGEEVEDILDLDQFRIGLWADMFSNAQGADVLHIVGRISKNDEERLLKIFKKLKIYEYR